MNEFELKLEIPASRLKAVQKELAQLSARAKVLRAVYYDTSTHNLRKHGRVLRVRKEGGRWVQAVKAESGRLLERLEDEVELGQRGPDAPLPVADAHRGSGVGKRLRKALGPSPTDAVWRPLFSTEVRRTLASVHEGGSALELALDRGRIVAGDDEVLLREIEFELKEGNAGDVVGVARQWRARHQLWLNPLSKFEKGLGLSSGKDPFDEAYTAKGASLAACVEQMLRNSAALADREDERPRRKALAKEMRKLRRQCLGDGRAFEQLDATRQHRVRKRLKRLRYLAEYAAPLYSSRRTEAFVDSSKPVQVALGLF